MNPARVQDADRFVFEAHSLDGMLVCVRCYAIPTHEMVKNGWEISCLSRLWGDSLIYDIYLAVGQ